MYVCSGAYTTMFRSYRKNDIVFAYKTNTSPLPPLSFLFWLCVRADCWPACLSVCLWGVYFTPLVVVYVMLCVCVFASLLAVCPCNTPSSL